MVAWARFARPQPVPPPEAEKFPSGAPAANFVSEGVRLTRTSVRPTADERAATGCPPSPLLWHLEPEIYREHDPDP
jgi:hypothetical protein